jgi:hypothetical protein
MILLLGKYMRGRRGLLGWCRRGRCLRLGIVFLVSLCGFLLGWGVVGVEIGRRFGVFGWDREKRRYTTIAKAPLGKHHKEKNHNQRHSPTNSPTGLVRAPLLTTLMQVASRLLLVWGIAYPFSETTKYSLAYSTMLIAWSVTEVIRYSYFVFALSGQGVPKIWTFFR